MELRHINEKGFYLVNNLLTAMCEIYLADLFPEDGLANQQAAAQPQNEHQN